LNRGPVGTGEQQFNLTGAQWANSQALDDPRRGGMFNPQTTGPNGQTATRTVNRIPGSTNATIDRAEWAKRYPRQRPWRGGIRKTN